MRLRRLAIKHKPSREEEALILRYSAYGLSLDSPGLHLGPNNSVFQAEVEAIRQAVMEAAVLRVERLSIHSDSQAAIKSLRKGRANSKTVISCIETINQFPGSISINWVKGHSQVDGNERADSLARAGTADGCF